MGKLIILFMFCVTMSAQVEPVSTVTIGGVEYEFVGDNNAWFRVDDAWWKTVDEIGETDDNVILESYVRAVVREGIINGADLNLAVNRPNALNLLRTTNNGESINVPVNSITLVDPSFYPNPLIGGSSWNSLSPGYVLTINRDHWNRISYTSRINLMFHELGHAIYNFGHVCQYTSIEGSNFKYRAFMSTGACSVANDGPGYSEVPSPYDLATFDGSVEHYFNYNVPIGHITRKSTGKSSTGKALVPIHD